MSAIQQALLSVSSLWNFSMTAAADGGVGSFDGYRDLDAGSDYGSLSPNTTPEGHKIIMLTEAISPDGFRLWIRSAVDLGSGYYNRIVINGTTYLFSAAAGYSYQDVADGGGFASIWQWAATLPVFVPSSNYSIGLGKS